MPTITTASAVEYASYLYARPLTQFNLGKMVVPSIPSLKSIQTPQGHAFKIRVSHGILHAIAAMEAIDPILAAYEKHVQNWASQFIALTSGLGLTKKDLIELVKIAVLFHDSARKGDGADLWDNESGDACYTYLTESLFLEHDIATLIADTIRYKDDSASYVQKHGQNSDCLRELVNMADNLEVIRCRDQFKPEYLELFKHVAAEQKLQLIRELVVPHRDRIFQEGRLHRKGHIVFPGYQDDRTGILKTGYDQKKIAAAYDNACERYPNIALFSYSTASEKEDMFRRVLRGIDTYMQQHDPKLSAFSRPRFFANSQFCPAGHTLKDYNRAKCIKIYLLAEQVGIDYKIALIEALVFQTSLKRVLTSTAASLLPLQLEVQRSLGHYTNVPISEGKLHQHWQIHALLTGAHAYMLAMYFELTIAPQRQSGPRLFETPHARLINHFGDNRAFLSLFSQPLHKAQFYHDHMKSQGLAIKALGKRESHRMLCVGLAVALGSAIVAALGVSFLHPLFAILFLGTLAAALITVIKAYRNHRTIAGLLTEIDGYVIPENPAPQPATMSPREEHSEPGVGAVPSMN